MEGHSGVYCGKVKFCDSVELNSVHMFNVPPSTRQQSYGSKSSVTNPDRHRRHQGSSYPCPVQDESIRSLTRASKEPGSQEQALHRRRRASEGGEAAKALQQAIQGALQASFHLMCRENQRAWRKERVEYEGM